MECAIKCYRRAVNVYTREAFSVEWARTECNLGLAQRDHIEGRNVE